MNREEIFAEVAEKLAVWKPVMVADLNEVRGNTRTVLVDRARIDGVEGIVHVISKRGKFWAKFTSDAEYRERWGS